jgi:hypothetical protein
LSTSHWTSIKLSFRYRDNSHPELIQAIPAAMKLGHIKGDFTFMDSLAKQDQHENLYVFAIKESS